MNAAPVSSSPSVRVSGGRGAVTLALTSGPKILARVWEYCLPVISRTRKGELLPSGSLGPFAQPAKASAVTSRHAVRQTCDLKGDDFNAALPFMGPGPLKPTVKVFAMPSYYTLDQQACARQQAASFVDTDRIKQ